MEKCTPYSILLLAIGASNGTNAQQPFPTVTDEPQWNVLSCIYGIGTWCQTSTIHFVDSMNMCGHSYSAFADPGGSPNDTAYVRNAGQRTWLRRSTDCSEKEYLMYDYSMGIGDTVYAGLNMDYVEPDTARFILQAIDTIEILGVERRRFSMMFERCNEAFLYGTMEWIEGIGSSMHPFYSVECLCDFCEQSLTLLCYDSSGVQLYVDPVFETCDTLITAINGPDEAHASVLHVYHDGNTGSLLVTVDPDVWNERSSRLVLVLMASDGRLVQRQDLSGLPSSALRMNVASVASGGYVLLLTDDRERLAGQRVVVP